MAGVQVSPNTPTQGRHSGRLREKSQRRFSLPSREEVFEKIAPYSETPSKHYSHLRPRNLVNNFIKERNRYNNPDGIDLFDENSDEEFINDKSSSDEEADEEESSVSQEGSSQNSASSEEERGRPGGRLGSRRGNVKSVPPGWKVSRMVNEESDEELAAPLRTNKRRLQLEQSSSSEEENNSSPVKRKKRRHNVSIQSDGSSSEGEELPSNPLEETMVPETRHSEEDQQSSNQDKVPSVKCYQIESSESDSSFIATSDSSDDIIPVFGDWERARSSKPTHEELVCNYRQSKSKAARQSQRRKRQRICPPSSGSSSSDNEGSGEDGSASGERIGRPPSKRAESLSSKKKAWKSQTLGRYQEERERRLSEKKDKTRIK